MKNQFLDFLSSGVPVIFDGAMGTQIQKFSLPEECFQGAPGCNEILNLSSPKTVIAVHEEYLNAGVNVIETNTFGASRPKLNQYRLGAKVYEINKAAASIARQAADQYKSKQAVFVCGSMGPTGYLPSSRDESLGKITFDQLVEIFQEQAEGLLDGGVDILLIETSQDLLEARGSNDRDKTTP